jgi:hypothetical protein
MDSTEPRADKNGDASWEQQQSVRDLEREVKRQGKDLEWLQDVFKSLRESVQGIGKRQNANQKTLDKIYLRIALLIGAVAGGCLLFGYMTGNILPWFKP